MANRFHTKIRQSLANPNLQEALDGNADRRRLARTLAYTSLPQDLQDMRQRAHAIRSQTITDLNEILEQFIQNAQANGLIIHRAEDTLQARKIVLDIAQTNKAQLIVKSKTMVGEEIKINQALEEAGIRVVETDLGEYIVQLRGEPPAHIITPAVHLRRGDVAATFQDKLGIPYNEDITSMTQNARRIMREIFLNADLGITGVNFGVAQTGSLCIITNEGNGRMVTTIPPVHIALMGIERLVPSMDDLALMLYLLPRSATGQKITVYTSLIKGPRREGEIDGPRERHLVLVDNGRSLIRESNLAEILYCIRCGACLNACPVFREIGGHAYIGTSGATTPYPGPIGSIVSPALFGQPEFGQLARATSLCGACKEACPVDIDLPKLLLQVRAGGMKITPTSEGKVTSHNKNYETINPVVNFAPNSLKLGLRFFTWLATSPGRFRAAQRLVGFASRILAPTSKWIRFPAFTGWGYQRDFPRPAATPFRDRFSEISGGAKAIPPEISDSTTISPPDQTSQSSTIPKSAPLSQVEKFETELTALGGNFYRCTATEIPPLVTKILKEKGENGILSWEANLLPDGLLEELEATGIKVTHNPDESLRVGLTGAIGGVAETGTIVLPSGTGQPLSASLLPEFHIAILRAESIFENLPQALNLEEVRESTSVNLITGPSRTADIEMTLTIGVHGPSEVHVICVG